MHDFGKLGKWSENTLKELSEVTGGIFPDVIIVRVKAITEKYQELKEEYEERMQEITPSFGFFKKPSKTEFIESVKKITEMQKEIDQLNKDYEKYLKVMEKFERKEEKKRKSKEG